MKRILITGKNSYIGNSFKEWLSQWPNEYQVDEIETKNNVLKTSDFKGYDSVLHLAGIAHKSLDPELKQQYYKINRDLTYDTAVKAKKAGISHFVFMSCIIVYGTKNEIVTKDTIPVPDNFYGDSKLQAEEKLKSLDDQCFNVATIRSPMVYGEGAKGNYPKLVKIASLTPIFPDYMNKRSMIHVDNLSEFIRLIITDQDKGVFHPQNREYVSTSDMVRLISKKNGKKIKMTNLFNFIIKYLRDFEMIKKIFGNLTYDLQLSEYKKEYRVKEFKETILLTENKKVD